MPGSRNLEFYLINTLGGLELPVKIHHDFYCHQWVLQLFMPLPDNSAPIFGT
jgi:hypothetical protein